MNLPCAIDCQMFEPISSPDDGATPELEPEEVQEQLSQPEDRHRDADQREQHAGAIPERPALDARDDADRDADEDPQDRGADRQRDRDREAPVDLLLDRHEVPVRVVDVLVQEEARPRDEPLGEPAVLDVERLVQAERLACRLDLLGGGGPPHRAARRVSGRELHEDEEREQRDDEEHQDHEERPSDQVPAHRIHLLAIPGFDREGAACRDPLRIVPHYRVCFEASSISPCSPRPADRTQPVRRTGRTSS